MDGPVILFDGACGFCTRGVLFVHARDRDGRFRFAPLGSATGRRLLAEHGVPEEADTMVLVDEGRAHVRSDAALRIARRLRWPWSWLGALGRLVPRRARDAVYDAIARRRHALGGECPVPPPSLKERML